jgi:glycerate dehydrogenase
VRPSIVCLDDFTLNPGDNPWTDVEKLGDLITYDRTPVELIVERAADAEIILANKTLLSSATIAKLEKLRFISVLATGYNVVDVKTAMDRGIPVSNVPIYGTDAVAEFVIALILNFTKRVQLHADFVRSGEWTTCSDFCFWHNSYFVELAGKTIGIVGFGRIGRRVGELAHAFKMKVIAFDDYKENVPAYPFEWREIRQLFAESDFVSLHCPLTDSNKGMVNKTLLPMMKKSAFLINTARGLLVEEKDLAYALNSGMIAGAACDVLSEEPPKSDNPLLSAKNIVITPHIAWAALEARRRLMKTTAENIAAFLSGNPQNVVNSLK